MWVATRSVFFTLVLMIIFLYVFGIIFKLTLACAPDRPEACDPNAGELFRTVGISMWTLILAGTFLDDICAVASTVLEASPLMMVILAMPRIKTSVCFKVLVGVGVKPLGGPKSSVLAFPSLFV